MSWIPARGQTYFLVAKTFGNVWIVVQRQRRDEAGGYYASMSQIGLVHPDFHSAAQVAKAFNARVDFAVAMMLFDVEDEILAREERKAA